MLPPFVSIIPVSFDIPLTFLVTPYYGFLIYAVIFIFAQNDRAQGRGEKTKVKTKRGYYRVVWSNVF